MVRRQQIPKAAQLKRAAFLRHEQHKNSVPYTTTVRSCVISLVLQEAV